MDSRHFILLAVVLTFVACSPIHSVKTEGSRRTTLEAKSHFTLVVAHKVVGTQVVIDTVTGKIVERAKFNQRLSWNGKTRGRVKTTYFDTTGRVIKVVTVRNGDQVTVENR